MGAARPIKGSATNVLIQTALRSFDHEHHQLPARHRDDPNLGSQCKALAPYRNATRTVSGIAEAYQQGAEGGAKGSKNDDQARWLMR